MVATLSRRSRSSEVTPQRLLQSIVEVTEQKDCKRFRISLADTLREMLPLQELLFARPLHDGDQVHFRVAHSETSRALAEARLLPRVNAGDPSLLGPQNVLAMMTHGYHLQIEGKTAIALLPVIHRDTLQEVLLVRAEAIPNEALTVMRAFTRLYRNFMALIIESEKDPLTGLFNRKTLEVRLAAILREAGELGGQQPASKTEQRQPARRLRSFLIIIDIDHFKRINDTLGHLFGDEVIILVTRLMREVFRNEDALFRYGGEEFVVAILAEDEAGARAAAERFRQKVAAHRFPQLDQVTISAGMVEFREGDVATSLLGHADQALYHAKRSGRNRVVTYGDLLRETGTAAEPAYGGVVLF
ncbi:MAG TPA: GGDEF domain-containing protein [Nevskiaceae bacterium]|nr:GGDEF domain-containing protein [Nevskiaceae bacterium]